MTKQEFADYVAELLTFELDSELEAEAEEADIDLFLRGVERIDRTSIRVTMRDGSAFKITAEEA